jgi:hypothetical protein
VLKLALASGSKGAPDLVSFKLTLPAGFGFNKSKLGKDLALGGVAHGYTLKGRSVTIYLSKPASKREADDQSGRTDRVRGNRQEREEAQDQVRDIEALSY